MAHAVRLAAVNDIEAMHRIRMRVRENVLVSTVITPEDYRRAMQDEGRAWVCEAEGEMLGFACARPTPGDVWALFVDPDHEARGAGRALMDVLERWCFEDAGMAEVKLCTAPGTRAEAFYLRRGWEPVGTSDHGEVVMRLRPTPPRV